MRLQEKVVFITDADSSSGKTLMNRLAVEGARFILNSPSGGEEIAANLAYCQAAGSKAITVNIDLCQEAEVGLMLEEAAQRVGAVDILIHNQNLVVPASVESCDEELFLKIMNANAKSAFICTQAAGKQMAAGQSGKIIYISSIHAEKPTGSSFVYSVSKSAVKMLAREAAIELGRYGINVNTIEMGPVEGDDEMFRSPVSTLYEDYRYKVPNTILGTYDDLAECVLYLSTAQSRYMNGADIRLDGGFVLHYMDHKMKKS
ncbi:MAG: short-chain dehydrogenase [Paenibacillus sp.]|nr:short-chain dehydrogenase [Paenibacillus sp.]